MDRSPAGIFVYRNNINQGSAVAATSGANCGGTGHCTNGTVCVGATSLSTAAQGSALDNEHPADDACGGERSRNCSSAERQSGRGYSGPASKRGVSTRDAGALHRSTSVMACMRDPPWRSIGTSGSSRDTPACSAAMPNAKGNRARLAPALAQRTASAHGSCPGRPAKSQARQWLGGADAAGGGQLATALAPHCARSVRSRHRHVPMARAARVPKNRPVRVTTKATRQAKALRVAEARAQTRVTSGGAARSETVAATVLMGGVIARERLVCQPLKRKKVCHYRDTKMGRVGARLAWLGRRLSAGGVRRRCVPAVGTSD